MGVRVHIPTDLRKLTGGQRTVEVEAGTVRKAIAALDALYPGLWHKFYDKNGNWKSVYLILVNNKNPYGVGMPGGNTPLKDTDEVMIVYSAMSG
jgi:molybdopterin converting factor small subunit